MALRPGARRTPRRSPATSSIYHSTPEQAAQDAKAAGVRYLMLNHIVPPLPVRFAYPAFLGDARLHYDGPITVGEDGMMLSLPAGGHEIVLKRLLPP